MSTTSLMAACVPEVLCLASTAGIERARVVVDVRKALEEVARQ